MHLLLCSQAAVVYFNSKPFHPLKCPHCQFRAKSTKLAEMHCTAESTAVQERRCKCTLQLVCSNIQRGTHAFITQVTDLPYVHILAWIQITPNAKRIQFFSQKVDPTPYCILLKGSLTPQEQLFSRHKQLQKEEDVGNPTAWGTWLMVLWMRTFALHSTQYSIVK